MFLQRALLSTSVLHAQGGDGLASPAKSAPLGLVRTKCAGTSAARLQFFPTVLCQEERPVSGLPSRT